MDASLSCDVNTWMTAIARAAAALLLVLIPTAATAQFSTQVLVPIKPGTTPGAYGSLWQTELVLTNTGDTPLTVTGYPDATPIPPKASVFLRTYPDTCNGPGIILTVEAANLEQFAASLRTRDVSRQLETAGTTIPLITHRDNYVGNLGITDVPMEPGFRSTLRVYGLDSLARVDVDRVRFYALDPERTTPTESHSPDRLILEMPTRFTRSDTCLTQYFEIALDQVPELANAGRIRIEVDSASNHSTRPYWAFVSVTHNETQHVTVILPH